MTETDWLQCDDPESMLRYLRGKTSERKLRLADCALCRRLWDLLADERSREAVLVAERFADGLATGGELKAACAAAREAAESAWATPGESAAWQAWIVAWDPPHTAWVTWNSVRGMVRLIGKEAQCRVLHDIFGNPFSPVSADPAWLTPPVVGRARSIYDDNRFEDLPRLADDLEAAGCGQAHVLEHCRNGGEHARGCWVMDLVLGKG